MKTPIALFGLVLLWGCGKSGQVAGTNDETHTEVAARIFKPGGQGFAVGATVKVVPLDSTQAVSVGAVGDDGHPVVGTVPDGIYSVSVTQAGAVVVVDSVPAVAGRIALVQDDTLELSGTLSGVVAVQPQDDPSTVVVQVLGTENYCNVAQDGKFTLTGMPTGRVRLRLTTSLPDYTTTFDTSRALSGQDLSIPDTLRMVYTGIPVVTGLRGWADSATGQAILSWSAVRFAKLQDYLVFRDTAGSIAYSTVPFAATSDTSWTDTASDSLAVVQAWRYRIEARSKVGAATGAWYGSVTVVCVPPALRRGDSATWTEIGPGGVATGTVGSGLLASANLGAGGSRRTFSVRSSADGLVWDSAGAQVPTLELGQVMEWDPGIGAGRAWALGHSSIGDGVRAVSWDGTTWSDTLLDESLWTGTGSRVVGCGTRTALVGPGSSPAVSWTRGDGIWHTVAGRGRILGAGDSALYSDGGGSHLLQVSWDDPSRVLRYLGTPPEPASSLFEWNGVPCFRGAHGIWVLDPDGWALRRSPATSAPGAAGSFLLAVDPQGSLWKGVLK